VGKVIAGTEKILDRGPAFSLSIGGGRRVWGGRAQRKEEPEKRGEGREGGGV